MLLLNYLPSGSHLDVVSSVERCVDRSRCYYMPATFSNIARSQGDLDLVRCRLYEPRELHDGDVVGVPVWCLLLRLELCRS